MSRSGKAIILIALIGGLPLTARIPTIRSLKYGNPDLMTLRREVAENMRNFAAGKPVRLKWRKYVLKKKDNFFVVMARTQLNHETLASVNRLASYWDLQPGDTWLIPNMRGSARYGRKSKLAKKFLLPVNAILPVPGKKGLYFIPGLRFENQERHFLSGKAFLRPVTGRLSSGYGARKDPFSRKSEFHKGIDIACPSGSKVRAAASGRVIFTGWKSGYGKTIILEHASGYQTLYGHLKKIKVKRKQKVKAGSLIALSGKTGKATGPHLHFEVRRRGRAVRPKLMK